MHRGLTSELTTVAIAFAIAGCSPSTEPKSNVSSDGLAVHLQVEPSPAVVGDYVRTTLTIENTTDHTVTRTYPSSDIGPDVVISESANVLVFYGLTSGFFGPFTYEGQLSVLSLAPHQSRSAIVEIAAIAPGNAELRGCLTKGDGPDAVCVDAFVTVTAH
jgi:hypothetical protein